MKAFTQLVHRYLHERGWNIKDLATAIAPRNQAVAHRKIADVLTGKRMNDGVLLAVSRTLNINHQEREAALAEDLMERRRLIEEYQRPRFRPHVWIEVTPGWFPSLLTITGPDIYRRLAVPAQLCEVIDEAEIIRLMGQFVVNHFNSAERRIARAQVTHYLYRQAFDVGYSFTPDGSFISKVCGPYLSPIFSVRVG